jgi:hypothetical protein
MTRYQSILVLSILVLIELIPAYANEKLEFIDSSYEHVKKTLIMSGWAVDTDDVGGTTQLDEHHPEIRCGEGYDALCQTGFSKVNGGNKETIILTVEVVNNILKVSDEAYEY